MKMKYAIKCMLIVSALLAALCTACTPYKDRHDFETGSGDGRGDSTNTLRYQNHTVK